MKIAVVPGDGIGVDVTAEAVKVLDRVARARAIPFEPVFFPWSADHYLKTGITIPDGGFDDLASNYDAIFMGAFGDPRVPDMKHAADILLGARFRLDLYVNYRPVRCLDDRLCPLKGFARRGRGLRGLPREHRGLLRRGGRALEEGHAGRGRGPGGRLDPQGRRADHPVRVRVRPRPRTAARRDVRQVERDAVRRRSLAAGLRRRREGFPRDRGVAPLHRRALHADGQGSPAVRGHRHEQHVRGHRDGSRRGAAGRPGHGGVRQHPSGPCVHVRAGARVGAEVRRNGQGQPVRRDPHGGAAAGPPRARRGGLRRRGGRGGLRTRRSGHGRRREAPSRRPRPATRSASACASTDLAVPGRPPPCYNSAEGDSAICLLFRAD